MKYLLSLILVLGSFSGFSQSKIYTGISGNYIHSEQNEIYTNTNAINREYHIGADIGFLYNSRSAAGIRIGYGDLLNTGNYWNTSRELTSYQVGVFWRKYYPLSEKIYFILNTRADFTYSDGMYQTIGPVDQSVDNFNIIRDYQLNIQPTFAFMFSKHWSGEVVLGGVSYSNETESVSRSYNYLANEQPQKRENVNFDLTNVLPSIGITYYFGGNTFNK